jgi:hypothetical protein
VSRIALLGPQRLQPTVAPTLESLGVKGRVATVTAGWQERESEDQELHEHLHERSVNLQLWKRAEEIFGADQLFAAAHHKRQETMRELRDIYNLRLAHAKKALYELLDRPGDPKLIEQERLAALDAVRDLDARHLERIRAIRTEFAEKWRPAEREDVVRHREELADILADCEAVALAGGHIAVLLNRFLLFDLASLIGSRVVVAWSASAMAITERVVLFHDYAPQGAGNSEVMDCGLGLARGVVPLPHARRRLKVNDAHRVWVFARRFAPAICVPMDEGSRIDVVAEEWRGTHLIFAPLGGHRLGADGSLVKLAAAA